MLGLLSRAGPQVTIVCHGRCPSCGPGLVGRFNCWAARLHAKRYHSGTFLYSAILAAAVIIDTSAKSIRNKEWEAALTKSREEMAAAEESAQERMTRLLESGSSAGDMVREKLRLQQWEVDEDGQFEDSGSESEGSVSLSLDSVFKYSTSLGALRPQLPTTSPPITSTYGADALPPQSVWSGEIRRRRLLSRSFTEKKLCVYELSAMRLILRLMNLIGMCGRSKEELDKTLGYPSEKSLETYARLTSKDQLDLVRRLKVYMKTELYPLPPWQGDRGRDFPIASPDYRTRLGSTTDPDPSGITPLDVQEQTSEINHWLYNLFVARRSDQITFNRLVVSICDLLLRSNVPPNIDTLNILLLGFEELQLEDDVRSSIVYFLYSFQSSAYTRVNEFYCAAILRHYREQDEFEKFTKFIGLMRGFGHGLMLARPDVKITAGSQGRLRRRKNGKVNQAIHPMPIVYWEIIKGILHFTGFGEAVNICKGLQEEAWGLDWRCLSSLLTDCVRRADWEDGRLIWREVILLTQKTREIPRLILAVILALCRVCHQEKEYEDLLQWAMEKGHDKQEIQHKMLSVLQTFAPDAALLFEQESAQHSMMKPTDRSGGIMELDDFRLTDAAVRQAEAELDALLPGDPHDGEESAWGENHPAFDFTNSQHEQVHDQRQLMSAAG